MASKKLKRLNDEEHREFMALKEELDEFDMNTELGGYVDITRKDRLERAWSYSLVSDDYYKRMKTIMEGKASQDDEINRRLYEHCRVEPRDTHNPLDGRPEHERYWK